MANSDPKEDLRRYLQQGREAMLWKLDGLPEYEVRRPLTPTGTNLLGLVKHLAGVEIGYFGDTFGRPFPGPVPAAFTEEGGDPNADMYAAPGESRELITGLYRQVWVHSDATIDALALDAPGQVPWWPADHRDVTLHWILVHVATETHRHAGHADIVRELIDGAAGHRAASSNLPAPIGQSFWAEYRERVEKAAAGAGRS